MITDQPDDRPHLAAAFLAQALDLADDPTSLVADLESIAAEPLVAVYAAELTSSLGPAAFLIYAYDLSATAPDGQSGRARLATDLATLERAASLDAPGPRLVAHASDGDRGFILATTPETHRALTGDTVPSPSGDKQPPVQAPITDPDATRRQAASDLLRLLREANEQARTWSAAVAASRTSSTGNLGLLPSLLTPEETELALFLLDDQSIKSLLTVLNTLLTTARERAFEPPA